MSLGTQQSKTKTPPRRSIIDVIRWLIGRRRRFLVKGRSMMPTLHEGASVFISQTREPQMGDIVIMSHPENINKTLIKRCTKIKDGMLWIEGDNHEQSTDSRDFGWLTQIHLVGVVTSQL